MASRIAHLTDLVPVETLEEILNNFTKSTKLCTLVTDYQGRPITSMQRFNSFCKCVRKHPELEKLCIRSDASAGFEAANAGQARIYVCHAGMVDAVVPIIIDDDHYLGAIFTGQVLLQEEDMGKVDHLGIPSTIDSNTFPDVVKSREDYQKNGRRITLEEMQANVDLLTTIANHIANLAYTSLMQEEISQSRMRLKEKTKQEEDMENRVAELELKVRQGQMNPTFLFNAFNSIHRQAILENAEKTSRLVHSLSGLLRRNLDQSQSFTTVEDEINYIRNYIDLNNVSTRRKTKLQLKVSPDCLDCYLPFFALQPLVENVFTHGPKDPEKEYQLLLSARREGFSVRIEMSDRSLYFSEEELERLTNIYTKRSALTATTLSFQNVVTILTQYYGESFQWQITSTKEEGTRLTLRIPYSVK